MKTRLIMIIALTLAALALLLGLTIGRKNTKEPIAEVEAKDSVEIAERVLNLIILDESGSMYGLEEVCVEGVNHTIRTIRESYEKLPEQKQLLTFLTFSSIGESDFRTRFDQADISSVQDYKVSDYRPMGGTPLYDAMGTALTKLEQVATEKDIVLVTVITDGHENSSRKYNAEKIRNLIARLDEKDWVFTYIGANQDAVLEAERLGIRNAMNYDADLDGTREMWEKERSSRTRFLEGARTGTEKKRLKNNYFINSGDYEQ